MCIAIAGGGYVLNCFNLRYCYSGYLPFSPEVNYNQQTLNDPDQWGRVLTAENLDEGTSTKGHQILINY